MTGILSKPVLRHCCGDRGVKGIAMALKLRKWDSAKHLKTEEDMALYFEACLEQAGDDAAFIAKALGNISRARGLTQAAEATGNSIPS